MKRFIAYIPARGGSQRIPKKNIKLLGGRPVLTRVIESLRGLDFLEAVCVSTDDPKIKQIAERAGATVLSLRSKALSGSHPGLGDLLKRDMPRYFDSFGIPKKDAGALIVFATAALMSPSIFRQAYKQFLKSKRPILVATRHISDTPFRALVRDRRGFWMPLFPEKLKCRSQDLPEAQIDAGQFYFLDYKKLAGSEAHWFDRANGPACFTLPDEMAVDVDEPKDWKELEIKFARQRAMKKKLSS